MTYKLTGKIIETHSKILVRHADGHDESHIINYDRFYQVDEDGDDYLFLRTIGANPIEAHSQSLLTAYQKFFSLIAAAASGATYLHDMAM